MSARSAMLLFGSAAAVALTGMSQVVAQTNQVGAATSSGMEEIVVTARRANERIQTVPIAITAFSQADLEKKQIHDISDLAREVPSLNVSLSQSDTNAGYAAGATLRGLPGTVVYFNDVPIGSTDYSQLNGILHSFSPGFLYDLDHLEVDKGPQGTLFGKNSIGGLIAYQSQRPTNTFEGYVQATFGDYGDREFEGAANIPIVQDKLAVRIAGQSQQRDGYTTDLQTGKDLDNRNYYSWRISVKLTPSDDFQDVFVYDGYWQDTNGSSNIARYVNPDLDLGGITVGQIYPNLSALLAQQQRNGARLTNGPSIPLIGKDYFYGLTNITTWDISENLTLKNIAAARVFKQLFAIDDSNVGLPLLTIGGPTNNTGWDDNSVQYTEEIQLQGKALGDKLSWVLGGFLEFDHPLGALNGEPTQYFGTVAYYYFHNSARSQAAFVHGIYDLSDYVDGLRFTGGYRYTWDYLSVQQSGTGGVNTIIRDPAGNPLNCSSPANYDRNCTNATNAHYSSFGWNVGLDDQITHDTLVYVRAGNAYRPGGVNSTLPAEFQQFKPEHVTDVELGVKSDWQLLDGHVRTNADIFHTDYKSIQVSQLVPVSTSSGPTVESATLNAASASLYGAEFEMTWTPLKSIEISPHASYIFAQYEKYPAEFGGTDSSKPPFGVPKWQYGVTGTYYLPVDEAWGTIAASLAYSWKGHQYVTFSPGEPANIIASSENLDLRVDWTNMFGQPLDLGAFVSNLTDNTHITGITALYTSIGFTSATYNAPRMFGFSLKYRFGGQDQPEEAQATYTAPPVVAPAPTVPKSYLVFFDFNRSDLSSRAAIIVDEAAKNATSTNVSKLEVTGHTDTVGSDAYNMRLSRRRAEAVAARLEQDGIAASEIEIVAKGKRDLLIPTADGVREPQNRRVQILYSGAANS